MSSKIKVDTIENVAGSGNVSLGSGHNLVVPGNITGQGTAAITGNTTVGGTLGVTGGTTLSSTANIGSTLTMSGDNFANHLAMANGGTGGTTFNIFSTSDSFAQPSANWMLHHASAGNGIILADQNGRVRMPYQPMFSMHTTNNAGMAAANSDIILNAGYNGGNHVNTSTGVFTVPVGGRYMFSAYAIKNNSNGVVARLRIVQNGSTVAEARMDESGNYTQACAVVILPLATNDAIKFTNGDSTAFYMGSTYGRCNGHLIG